MESVSEENGNSGNVAFSGSGRASEEDEGGKYKGLTIALKAASLASANGKHNFSKRHRSMTGLSMVRLMTNQLCDG